jgi:hypothetical protein
MRRNLIYLDIDGVLNPDGQKILRHWPDARKFDSRVAATGPDRILHPASKIKSFRLWRSPALVGALLGLDAEIVWATTWTEYLDTVIAPNYGFPLGLDRVDFHGPTPAVGSGKLPLVSEHLGAAGDVRAVWIDDLLSKDESEWADANGVLAIATTPSIGLIQAHIESIREWLS